MTRSRALACGAILALSLVVFFFRVSRKMPDFEVYWRGAVRAAVAEPLYRVEDEHYQFKYLPAFAVLAIPLGLLPLQVAKVLWFVVSIALLMTLITLSVDLLPQRRKSVSFLVAVALVVLGKFYAHELVLGQVNLLFAVIATGALLAMKAGRNTLAAVLVVFTIAIKPYGVLLLPWVFVRRQAGPAIVACVGALALFLLPAAVYGISGDLALHRSWWQTVNDRTAFTILNPDNVSLVSLYAKWLSPGQLASALAVVTEAGLFAAAIAVFAWRRGVAFAEGLEGSLLLTLIPLVSPQGWDYVLLLATPAIMYLANYEDELPGAMRALVIIAGLTIGLSLFDVMGRAAYAAFTGMGTVTLCTLPLVGALCTLRLKKIA